MKELDEDSAEDRNCHPGDLDSGDLGGGDSDQDVGKRRRKKSSKYGEDQRPSPISYGREQEHTHIERKPSLEELDGDDLLDGDGGYW